MKWGLIARADDRGLGHLAWEMHRHLHPDRTLVVDMGPLARGFPVHLDRYPDAQMMLFDPAQGLPEPQVREWLHGLDVVFSAETFYDWRVCEWADDLGVATVVHVMPEFHVHHSQPGLPRPTVWWAPTTWRLDHLPPDTRLVPVPVAARAGGVYDRAPGPLRMVHVAGHRAANDRNGTSDLLRALPLMRHEADLTVYTQDRSLPSRPASRRVRVTYRQGGVPDRWRMYADADLLVLPRRYGGLCLPAQEALAMGLAVAMPDTPPNPGTWPVVPLQCDPHGTMTTQGGQLQLVRCHPRHLAGTLDGLAADPVAVAEYKAAARAWAAANSWGRLGPLYEAELARAANHK